MCSLNLYKMILIKKVMYFCCDNKIIWKESFPEPNFSTKLCHQKQTKIELILNMSILLESHYSIYVNKNALVINNCH